MVLFIKANMGCSGTTLFDPLVLRTSTGDLFGHFGPY